MTLSVNDKRAAGTRSNAMIGMTTCPWFAERDARGLGPRRRRGTLTQPKERHPLGDRDVVPNRDPVMEAKGVGA